MSLHEGGCHCGRITARFETALDPATIEVRADQCGFCRRHGAKTVSDPAGRLTLAFREDDVRRHRFGARTADFLICRTCGHYIAAVIDDGFAVLNVVGADIQPFAARAAVLVDYDDETPEGRIARRRARWTPVTLEIAA
jgi:hypothetical protein